MDIFSALSDPNRRKILELLAASGPLSASEISEQFAVSPPAISQHLKTLREAGLVKVEKRAQRRIYRVNTQAMLALEDWAHQVASLWNQRFDALERVIEAEKAKTGPNIEQTQMGERNSNDNQGEYEPDRTC